MEYLRQLMRWGLPLVVILYKFNIDVHVFLIFVLFGTYCQSHACISTLDQIVKIEELI